MIQGFDEFWSRAIQGEDVLFKGSDAGSYAGDDAEFKDGVHTVSLVESDLKYFDRWMIPETELKCRRPGTQCIGAVKDVYVKDGVDADLMTLGILIYSVRTWPEDEKRAVLEWIYVAEPYRRRGVGRMLVREFMNCARDNGISIVMADLMPDESYRELAGFLAGLGFSFAVGSKARLCMSASDVSIALTRGKATYPSGCKAVCEAVLTDAEKMIRKLWRKTAGKDTDRVNASYPDRYDRKLSCILANGSDLKVMILIEKIQDKEYSIEYAGPCDDEHFTELAGMLLYVSDGIMDIGGHDSTVICECTDPETAEFLAELFPERLMMRVITAARVTSEDSKER